MNIQGEVLNQGVANGESLVLAEPVSFWGGFDPSTGIIIDQNHPQVGACTTGKILVMPGSKGSSGTPGALGEALRLKTGPQGIILCVADVNIVVAAQIVGQLYNHDCPVTLVSQENLEQFANNKPVKIEADGRIVQRF